MPGEHARFAPSSAERWLNCPASIIMTEHLPEDPESPYAHEGTVCHAIAAQCLRENKLASSFIGQVVEGVTITQELADAIQMYVDEVRGTGKEIGAKGGKVEFKINVTPDCWGTLDAAVWTPDLVVVMDAKFGKGVIVEAEKNPQLMIYSIGVFKMLAEMGAKPTEVWLKIIQPRTVNPIRTWKTTRAEVGAWANATLGPALVRLQGGDSTMYAGSYCRWCKITATCPANARSALDAAVEAFQDVVGDNQIVTLPIETATGGSLELAHLAELALKFGRIREWMAGVEAHLMDEALKGIAIPGMKVVEGRSVRKWKADESQVVAMLTANNIEAYEKTLLSPSKAEKAMGSKKARDIKFANWTVKPPGSPTLVPDTDKRPPMTVNVQQAFEEFVENPIVVLGEEKDEEADNLAARLRRSLKADEDLPQEEVKQTVPLVDQADAPKDSQIATSGSPNPGVGAENVDCTFPVTKSRLGRPSATKRAQVLDMGVAGSTLQTVAKAISATENGVRMHLRYLHERDGYGYTIMKDGSFVIHTSK